MKPVILTFSVLLYSVVLHGQAIEEVDLQKVENQSCVIKKGVALFPATDDVATFNGKDSWIIISKLSNVKTIAFNYAGDVTDDFTLTFSLRTADAKDFVDLTNETRKKILKNTLTPLSISISKYGQFDLRIRVQFDGGGGGNFAIEKLSVEKYSNDEITSNALTSKIEASIRSEEHTSE